MSRVIDRNLTNLNLNRPAIGSSVLIAKREGRLEGLGGLLGNGRYSKKGRTSHQFLLLCSNSSKNIATVFVPAASGYDAISSGITSPIFCPLTSVM